MDDQGEGGVFVRLSTGPNDGEPINSRVLRLKLSTNATEASFLTVSANGRLLYSQPFRSNLAFDHATGLYTTDIDVDIEVLHRLFPAGFLDPDAAPFTITVSLYGAGDARLITYGDWVGYIGKPWLEVTSLQADRGGGGRGGIGLEGEPPLGTLRVSVHTLAKDTFYFLLASGDRDLLTLSPEDPPLLRHARKLAAGSCGPGSDAPQVVHLDAVSDLPWRPAFLVLWTFDFYGGWKRSAVVAVE
jgi:hypothetical protein